MELETTVPGFWDDSREAQRKMRQLGRLKDTVAMWRGLQERSNNLIELAELAREEQDDSLMEELEEEGKDISLILGREEINLTLSGPYDDRSAIVTIQPGAGGTDSQDWAEMLVRMYTRWAETTRRPVEVMDLSYGDEAGLRSATLEISGQYAFGLISTERGVHRLVRLSPFDPNHLRHTSFAVVEVMPASEEEAEVAIRPEDIKLDFFRSSGPGGQNVQKVASAVRLTHLPTGLVISCQVERSQHQNREFAMRILRARLLSLQNEQRAQEVARLKGERITPEFGNQIRSYVLHPYKSVKDHRTNHLSTNPDKVLDGELDPFIQAYLMSQVGSG
ncbi:MAG TPA: peptide chain release factor 2 [Dehalococcoidia bacterium]|jgi:peptide chain release factor 2|nr:peptide chain release factor 2 [Dehalococcoidia bacterium]